MSKESVAAYSPSLRLHFAFTPPQVPKVLSIPLSCIRGKYYMICGRPDWWGVPGITWSGDIILRWNQFRKKPPLFEREAVGPGLLTLALLIIW